MLADFPPNIQREVRRILDGATRRLLVEERKANPNAEELGFDMATDADRLTVDEQRALIRAIVKSATVAPARRSTKATEQPQEAISPDPVPR